MSAVHISNHVKKRIFSKPRKNVKNICVKMLNMKIFPRTMKKKVGKNAIYITIIFDALFSSQLDGYPDDYFTTRERPYSTN